MPYWFLWNMKNFIYYQDLLLLFLERLNQKVNFLIYYWPISCCWYYRFVDFIHFDLLEDFYFFVKTSFLKRQNYHLFLTAFGQFFYQEIIYESKKLFFVLSPTFCFSFHSWQNCMLIRIIFQNSLDWFCLRLHLAVPTQCQSHLTKATIKYPQVAISKTGDKGSFLFYFLIFKSPYFWLLINYLIFKSDLRVLCFSFFIFLWEIKR